MKRRRTAALSTALLLPSLVYSSNDTILYSITDSRSPIPITPMEIFLILSPVFIVALLAVALYAIKIKRRNMTDVKVGGDGGVTDQVAASGRYSEFVNAAEESTIGLMSISGVSKQDEVL